MSREGGGEGPPGKKGGDSKGKKAVTLTVEQIQEDEITRVSRNLSVFFSGVVLISGFFKIWYLCNGNQMIFILHL